MRKILLLALALGLTLGTTGTALADGAKKAGTVTYDINLKIPDGAKTANVYLPYPMSDQNQDISDVRVSGNYDNQAVYHDPKTGSNYLMATWGSISGTPKLTFSFHVDSHYKKGGPLKDRGAKMPVDVLPYLAANDYLPSDNPKVRALAEKAVKGKKGTLARARAVYDWTIANTHRDNSVKGCGLGQAIRTLTEANGGGKCADISSVFITVARAAGSAPRLPMIIDLNRCTGWQSCVRACRAALDIPGHFRTRVDHGEDREKARAVFRPRLCNQCHPAACIKACPSKALAYGGDGVVRVNAAKCTGCRSCEKACPYGAIFVDRASRKAFKCEYCQDGVHSVPACVEACASGAR